MRRLPLSGPPSGRVAAVLLTLAATVVGLAGCRSFATLWRHSQATNPAVDVPYAARAGGIDVDDKQRLDVWAPAGAQGAPVVVFVHGGWWNSGDRRFFAPFVGLYGNFGVALADNDVVTVVPSYRLFPGVPSVEPMLDDVAAVVRWTHDHIAVHGGDPDRIVLAGHSAGGHLVMQLLTAPGALLERGVDPSWLKGAVSISGVLDVRRAIELTEPERRAAVLTPLFGADPDRWSPLARLSPANPHTPTLFLVGSDDYRTCLLDWESAAERLASVRGSHAFFVKIDGNTHEDMVLETGTAADDVGPAIAAFAHAVTSPSAPLSPSTPPSAPPSAPPPTP